MISAKLYAWLLLALFFLTPSAIEGQYLSYVSTLDPAINESSGLIEIEGHLITHNDSGDAPYLYVIDPTDGSLLNSIFIEDASHIDWEDITHDANYIYIGDIGNNDGDRQDLAIYKVPLYEAWMQDTLTAERIDYLYADQVSFSPSPFTTNYDAEALLSYGDSLYIFTKNWGDARSNVYACSKTPGAHSLNRIDSLDSQGYVTGATYSGLENEIMLCGYTLGQAFIIRIVDFDIGSLADASVTRYDVDPINSSYQIEAITHRTDDTYLLSSEQGLGGAATLQELISDTTNSLSELSPVLGHVFPNPTSGQVNVRHASLSLTEIFSASGLLIKAYSSADFSVSDLAPGLYHLILRDKADKIIGSFELIVE